MEVEYPVTFQAVREENDGERNWLYLDYFNETIKSWQCKLPKPRDDLST